MLTDEQLGSTLRRELNALGSEIHPTPELTRQLLANRPRRRRRLRAAERLPAVAAIAAAIIAAVVIAATDSGPSIVARAYAATDPTGAIVHYVKTSSFLQVGTRPKTAVTEIWRSGDQTHLIVEPNDPKQTEELAINGNVVQNYNQGTISYRLPARFFKRDCSSGQVLAQLCNNNTENDPITALRRLARSGDIHSVGHRTFRGRHVDVLTGAAQQIQIRALIDPRTFLPIEIQVVQRFRAPRPFVSLQLTTTVTDYQRLPFTTENAKLLLMRSHPHARIIHRCVGDTTCTSQR